MATTKFRPCIDLHEGQVKQIVGGTLTDQGAVENFVASEGAGHFAELFRRDDLRGGHVIQLGPGNREAAREALATWPGGLQLGGGVTLENASEWLEAGASAVIVTSYLFDQEGTFQRQRLQELAREIGPERLVIDLSCRRRENGWQVAMNRWQTLTNLPVTPAVLDDLAEWGGEFLIHAADVEGKCGGVDGDLLALLGAWDGRPLTYAGGVGTMADMELVQERSGGHVDVTVGSALDIFGGQGVRYADLVAWNQREENGE
ncbi:phosphoribosylformimino-5-aminoimidazole carboxamide ribotide isomerase [Roseibacillus ishigakijimensis]|uniref:Phosphoribosylformimino-5-aminoimidazole carboxamide ribotide isomerase n=1 Tax=Roseibacillus ishigakijimensis TaxID=454146 RepID=A0A934VHJ5_9BACT|nr:phosphoribosylformimino-5-aminoimidazole carboxamide ribotide isomerase [Roseibacillus ishigakijimensis]MBK1834033.1 phosphoribosylformimino-5-aminoimidazole carboxamide ribotide isomerase [Roseibacillus ishigakijimensis]